MRNISLLILLFLPFACSEDEYETECSDDGLFCCTKYPTGTKCVDNRPPPEFPQEQSFSLTLLEWSSSEPIWQYISDSIQIINYNASGRITLSSNGGYTLKVNGYAILEKDTDDQSKNDTISINVSEQGSVTSYIDQVNTSTTWPKEYVAHFSLNPSNESWHHSGDAYSMGYRTWKEMVIWNFCNQDICFNLGTDGYEDMVFY